MGVAVVLGILFFVLFAGGLVLGVYNGVIKKKNRNGGE